MPAVPALWNNCPEAALHKFHRARASSAYSGKIGLRRELSRTLRCRMLQVAYCHITFTLPHDLNGLARRNPWQVYNLMFRSAWQTIRRLCKKPKNVGGLPGMSAVLHTWGSDLKYHVHLHCLVTFGGYNEQDGQWHWPKRKRKIAPYRKLSGKYRGIFLKKLKKLMESGQVDYHQSYEELESSLPKKRWVVNHQWPTAETKVIEEYLGRYICRIGISNKRLSYDKNGQNVCIEYNNYREQKAGEPAPKAYRHMEPLAAMHQILQHQLPPYFQRSRHYGLHAAPTYERLEGRLPKIVKQEGATVRTVIQILQALLKEEPYQCENCSGTVFWEEHLAPDPAYTRYHVLGRASRSPPTEPKRAPPGTPASPKAR